MQFAVHQCGKHSHNPRASHAKAVKKICRCLQGTKSRGIRLKKKLLDPMDMRLNVFVDASFCPSVLLSNADFNRERTNKRNALNDVDFNEVRMPEFGQEQQLSFEKSDGETKSKVGRLISQFQEFAKASFK